MEKPQINLPQEMRCDQTAEREREHWLEAIADIKTCIVCGVQTLEKSQLQDDVCSTCRDAEQLVDVCQMELADAASKLFDVVHAGTRDCPSFRQLANLLDCHKEAGPLIIWADAKRSLVNAEAALQLRKEKKS